MELKGCRCLVVGGARRLGREIALSLAAGGADVVISSRSEYRAKATLLELEALGRRCAVVSGDVTARIDAHHLVRAAAAALGSLHAVIYSASGPFDPRRPEMVGEQEWDASMDVQARGLLFVAQAAREVFLGSANSGSAATPRTPSADALVPAPAEAGVIVAITDVASVQPWAAFAAHCAAKAAQLMLIRALAKAWAPEGIRVCGVAPGPVDLGDDERREASVRAAGRLSAGRLVQPAEVAAAVRLCLTTRSMTGANVFVDGGALLR